MQMPARKEKEGRIESLRVTVRAIAGIGSHRQPNHHALIPRLIRMPAEGVHESPPLPAIAAATGNPGHG